MLDVERLALEVVDQIAPLIPRVRSKSKNLADQLERALISVPLNLSEGIHSRGGNRVSRLATARGSAHEVMTALHVAVSFRALPRTTIDPLLRQLDTVCAMAWGLGKRSPS